MILMKVVVALALLLGRSALGSVAISGLGARCASARGLLREGRCAPEGPAGPRPQILWKGTHPRRGAASPAAAIGAWRGARLLRGGGSSGERGETQALGFAETQSLRFGTLTPDPSPARRHLNLQLWEASRRGLTERLAGLVQQVGLCYRLGGDMLSELSASIGWGVIEPKVIAPLRGASGCTLGPYCSPMPRALGSHHSNHTSLTAWRLPAMERVPPYG